MPTIKDIVEKHHESILNKELSKHDLIEVDFDKLTSVLDDAINVAYDYIESELTIKENEDLNNNFIITYIIK